MESKELRRVYDLLVIELQKVDAKIDCIEGAISDSDGISAEYWYDVKAEAVAYLNGLHRAQDIVWDVLSR